MILRRMHLDREHLLAFARFIVRRFIDDRCFETAGALAYTTLFALVPLTAVAIGILSAFPVFDTWTQQLIDFVFRNFVPAAGTTVREYVLEFASNTSRMTALGIIVLVVSALLMMSAIEDRLNRIWRVPQRRSNVSRFLVYWAVLSVGPILAVGGIAVSSYIAALPIIDRAAAQPGLHDATLRALPSALTLLAMLLLYTLVPNRRVRWRHAFAGALIATTLFEFAKWGFAFYVSRVPTYELLYGALATIPLFLLWIYLSWVIVLLGASIAASLASFDYRPRAERLPEGGEFLGLLHVLKHFVDAQRAGHALHGSELCQRERFLSDDLVARYLADLERAQMIEETAGHGWVLAVSLDVHGLRRVYEAGGYRIGLNDAQAEILKPRLPPPLLEMLAALRAELGAALDRPLCDLYPAVPAAPHPSPGDDR